MMLILMIPLMVLAVALAVVPVLIGIVKDHQDHIATAGASEFVAEERAPRTDQERLAA